MRSGSIIGDTASGNLEVECGFVSPSYFFLGASAFSKGIVAFLVDLPTPLPVNLTFTPFDTGALGRYILPAGSSGAPSVVELKAVIQQYLGEGEALKEFAGHYISAHFRDPHHYVTRAQTSMPDWPVYHGLRSVTGDRRAWTIEVQVHDNLSIKPESGVLRRIILSGEDLVADIPMEFRHLVKTAVPEEELAMTVAEVILEGL